MMAGLMVAGNDGAELRGRCPRRMLVMAAALLLLAGAVAHGQESPPAQPAETGAAEPAVREGVWVDFFFGTGLDTETRSVIEAGSVFPAATERVYCLTRVHGMRPPAKVTHAWYCEGKTMARVDLSVGSENWRTWSYKSLRPDWTGSWEVKVLDEDGMVLGSAGFEVK